MAKIGFFSAKMAEIAKIACFCTYRPFFFFILNLVFVVQLLKHVEIDHYLAWRCMKMNYSGIEVKKGPKTDRKGLKVGSKTQNRYYQCNKMSLKCLNFNKWWLQLIYNWKNTEYAYLYLFLCLRGSQKGPKQTKTGQKGGSKHKIAIIDAIRCHWSA